MTRGPIGFELANCSCPLGQLDPSCEVHGGKSL